MRFEPNENTREFEISRESKRNQAKGERKREERTPGKGEDEL